MSDIDNNVPNPEVNLRPFPWYEIHFLDVGDADCIAIKYRLDSQSSYCVALVDAGNVSDTKAVKDFLLAQLKTTTIDLAVCTHPDGDHKGGFLGLFEDDQINIHEFWIKNPAYYISEDDFAKMRKTSSMISACERIFNHPTDATKNLLELARSKINQDGSHCVVRNVICGHKHDLIPLEVVGPSEDYYREAAIEIVANYAELNCVPDASVYDEKIEITEEKARSVIDVQEEASPTNKGSIVLYFPVREGRCFLLTGDASSSSLYDVYERYGQKVAGIIMKVPHHGSKHNLNTKVIDALAPCQSIISAIGSKKHPNIAIVKWLSKYGNVYLTHKSKGLVYKDYNHIGNAEPLKEKEKVRT